MCTKILAHHLLEAFIIIPVHCYGYKTNEQTNKPCITTHWDLKHRNSVQFLYQLKMQKFYCDNRGKEKQKLKTN